MKVSAKIPIMFRAMLRGGRYDSLVAYSDSIDFEIPELSKSDAPVAFKSVGTFKMAPGSGDPLHRMAMKRFPGEVALRAVDGRLYRKVETAVRSPEDIKAVFMEAFPRGDVRFHSWFSANDGISSPGEPFLPLALKLFAQAVWDELRVWEQNKAERKRKILTDVWPKGPHGPADPFSHCNGIGAGDVLRHLRSFDADEIDRQRERALRHADFILVDGRLWRACRAPVLKVSWIGGRDGSSVTVVSAPEHFDTNMTTKYFALDDRDSAERYARELAPYAIYGGYDKERVDAGSFGDHVPDLDFDMGAIFEFDHAADTLSRFSHAFAAESWGFLSRNLEQYLPRVGHDRWDAVCRAYDEVLKTDWLDGVRGDPSPWLRECAEAWVSSGRRSASFQFLTKDISNMLIGRLIELFDERPVVVDPMAFARGLGR